MPVLALSRILRARRACWMREADRSTPAPRRDARRLRVGEPLRRATAESEAPARPRADQRRSRAPAQAHRADYALLADGHAGDPEGDRALPRRPPDLDDPADQAKPTDRPRRGRRQRCLWAVLPDARG